MDGLLQLYDMHQCSFLGKDLGIRRSSMMRGALEVCLFSLHMVFNILAFVLTIP